jgi:hypothetical protein
MATCSSPLFNMKNWQRFTQTVIKPGIQASAARSWVILCGTIAIAEWGHIRGTEKERRGVLIILHIVMSTRYELVQTDWCLVVVYTPHTATSLARRNHVRTALFVASVWCFVWLFGVLIGRTVG